ncbi:MAG TPA: glycosyltransferase family 2 protein [Gemmatimonadales bacterium]|nr:glycosyltransferase family 2 protein [Gemmatimonadales bacterium]
MRVSVAIPVYNEAGGIDELIRRVDAALDQLPVDAHEIVIVDDGSEDATRALLIAACERTSRLRVIFLSRNFGHQAALTAALDAAVGDVVAVMDGDLQDPPEVIPSMMQAHLDGADVVYAIRVGRKEALPLRMAYSLFYRLLRSVAHLDIPRDAGDFSLLSRRAVDQFRALPERHRFLRGLRAWVGFTQVGIPVERGARFAGRSKYSLRSLIRLALDGLFSFTTWPIRAAMVLGAVAILLAAGFSIYAVVVRLLVGSVPAGFTALVVVTVFLSGVNLFFLGVVGEYVGRIYDEVKQRPHYVIDRELRGSDTSG